MSNQVEQIRAEVERRIKSWADGVKYEGDAGDCQSRVTELTDLKKFIDSLPAKENPILVPADESPAAIAEEDDARERQRNGLPAYSPVLNQASLDKKIDAFSEAHKGETAEQIEAAWRGEEVPAEETGADLEAEIQRAWREEKESGKYADGSFDDFVCFQHIARHFAEWERERIAARMRAALKGMNPGDVVACVTGWIKNLKK